MAAPCATRCVTPSPHGSRNEVREAKVLGDDAARKPDDDNMQVDREGKGGHGALEDDNVQRHAHNAYRQTSRRAKVLHAWRVRRSGAIIRTSCHAHGDSHCWASWSRGDPKQTLAAQRM